MDVLVCMFCVCVWVDVGTETRKSRVSHGCDDVCTLCTYTGPVASMRALLEPSQMCQGRADERRSEKEGGGATSCVSNHCVLARAGQTVRPPPGRRCNGRAETGEGERSTLSGGSFCSNTNYCCKGSHYHWTPCSPQTQMGIPEHMM
jgi:hypothetical protein